MISDDDPLKGVHALIGAPLWEQAHVVFGHDPLSSERAFSFFSGARHVSLRTHCVHQRGVGPSIRSLICAEKTGRIQVRGCLSLLRIRSRVGMTKPFTRSLAKSVNFMRGGLDLLSHVDVTRSVLVLPSVSRTHTVFGL